MPFSVCLVYGYIYDLNGDPIADALVLAGVNEQPLLDSTSGSGFMASYIRTASTSTGYFELNLPKGQNVLLSIPTIGYEEEVFIPQDVSSVLFTALTG